MNVYYAALVVASIVGLVIGGAIHDGRQQAHANGQQLTDLRAAGCKRTAYHPGNTHIAIYTCPDGNVYKHREN